MVEAISAGESDAGAFLAAPPRFLSSAYHLRFLPRVIAWRLRRRRVQPQGFQHVQMEVPLVLFVCVLLVVFGLPSALQGGSIGGWISTVLGAGGPVALITWSAVEEWRWRRQQGHRYGYAEFMPSVFFFCILGGASAGLIAGALTDAPIMGYVWAGAGLILGYLAGPFAARWVHALGFMKIWFIYLAVLGLILLPLEDLVVLWIYSAKSGNGVWMGG